MAFGQALFLLSSLGCALAAPAFKETFDGILSLIAACLRAEVGIPAASKGLDVTNTRSLAVQSHGSRGGRNRHGNKRMEPLASLL
jgi:hypothetical protein